MKKDCVRYMTTPTRGRETIKLPPEGPARGIGGKLSFRGEQQSAQGTNNKPRQDIYHRKPPEPQH